MLFAGLLCRCVVFTSGAYKRYSADTALDAVQVLHDCFSSLTTTSPNSILLASLDETLAKYSTNGKGIVSNVIKLLDAVKSRIRNEGMQLKLRTEFSRSY